MSDENENTNVRTSHSDTQGAIAGIVHQATRVDYSGEEDFILSYAIGADETPTVEQYKMLVVVAVVAYLGENKILWDMEFGQLLAQIDEYVHQSFERRTNLDIHGFNKNADISDLK